MEDEFEVQVFHLINMSFIYLFIFQCWGWTQDLVHKLKIELCSQSKHLPSLLISNILQFAWHSEFWNSTDQLFWKNTLGFFLFCFSIIWLILWIWGMISDAASSVCHAVKMFVCSVIDVNMDQLVKVMPAGCLYYKMANFSNILETLEFPFNS